MFEHVSIHFMKGILLILSTAFLLNAFGQTPNVRIDLHVSGLDTGYYNLTLTEIISKNESVALYTDSLSKERNSIVIKAFVPEERYVYLTIRRLGAVDFGIGPGDKVQIELRKTAPSMEIAVRGSYRPTVSANYINKTYDGQTKMLQSQITRMDSLNIARATNLAKQQLRDTYDAIYGSIFRWNTHYADTVGSAVAAAIALIRYKYEASKYNISSAINRAIEKFDSLPTLTSLIVDDSKRKTSDPFSGKKDSIDMATTFSPAVAAAIEKIANKNKLVLIDFWTSWCKPCIEEFPYLDSAYQQFGNKQFEIISVSLDSDTDAWQQAKGRLKTSWTSHFIEEGAMESPPAKALKIKSIPRSYLIDSTGRVYGKNLRKKQLVETLSKLL